MTGKLDSPMKKMKLDKFLSPYTTNSKRIKDFNIRPKSIKRLEKNIDSKLLDICLGNHFLDLTSRAKATK